MARILCESGSVYETLRRSNPLQNGKADTTWANLRRKNGHEEPYNVKYWAIGNECWVSLSIASKALPFAYSECLRAHGKLVKCQLKIVRLGHLSFSLVDSEVK